MRTTDQPTVRVVYGNQHPSPGHALLANPQMRDWIRARMAKIVARDSVAPDQEIERLDSGTDQ